MGFIFWCMLTSMWLLDRQYYTCVENAVILLTEISFRKIKLYLFPFLISCRTDFAPHIKLVSTENCQYIIWKPSSSSPSVWSLSFLNVSCFFSLQCWIISIYPSNLPQLFLAISMFQLFMAEMLFLLLFGLAHFWTSFIIHFAFLLSNRSTSVSLGYREV